jgi:Uma2 family endonuclease
MSAAILPASPPADALRRKRFRRSEFDRMLELGLFDGQRCELIDGELIDKMGQDPPHAYAIRALFAWLTALFGADRLLIQSPIEVKPGDSDWSLPEPDVAVLAETGGDYRKRHPRGDELLLAIEVADASLRQDLTTKRDLYARASVGEYWVLDLQSRRLIVHRKPEQGEYKETAILNEGERASCAGHPEQTIAVRDLLP